MVHLVVARSFPFKETELVSSSIRRLPHVGGTSRIDISLKRQKSRKSLRRTGSHHLGHFAFVFNPWQCPLKLSLQTEVARGEHYTILTTLPPRREPNLQPLTLLYQHSRTCVELLLRNASNSKRRRPPNFLSSAQPER